MGHMVRRTGTNRLQPTSSRIKAHTTRRQSSPRTPVLTALFVSLTPLCLCSPLWPVSALLVHARPEGSRPAHARWLHAQVCRQWMERTGTQQQGSEEKRREERTTSGLEGNAEGARLTLACLRCSFLFVRLLFQWFCHLGVLAILYFVTGFEAATIVSRNWMQLFWVSSCSRAACSSTADTSADGSSSPFATIAGRSSPLIFSSVVCFVSLFVCFLLFQIANIAGWILAFIAYIKALVAPTHVNDNKWSGSFWYDLFMGVEHNPRLSSHPYSFDFKVSSRETEANESERSASAIELHCLTLSCSVAFFFSQIFFNGRPGICAWTLINLCFAATQFYRFGFVSNSMMILNFLQSIYVLDFFWNEGWYLRTIDICHEHFGYYLSWGDLVWLPFMYTLQGLFLASHPVQLSPAGCVAVLSLGLGGYLLFRAVNAEKDRFRKEMKRLDKISNGGRDADKDREKNEGDVPKVHQGRVVQYKGQTVFEIDYKTWFGPTRYLAARYYTGFKNEQRQSYLLLSGFWSGQQGGQGGCSTLDGVCIVLLFRFSLLSHLCFVAAACFVFVLCRGLSRHMNYLGDLMLSFAFCLTCGFTHLQPYFYIVFMTLLLLHRVARDDDKCRQKYGKVWDNYCSIVKYKICPFVY